MRIAWARVGTVVLSVGLWAALLLGGRHMLHMIRGEAHLLARLAIGRRGLLI
jgi:hypothetical protein